MIESLDDMTTIELVARYEEFWGRKPRTRNRTYLMRRIAWKEQEKKYGGLSLVAKRKLDELISEIDIDLGSPSATTGVLPSRKKANAKPLPVGTTIRRPWKGKDIIVVVTEAGFEHDGEVFRSLSAIAKAVTGSHWNGRAFFGLTKRSRK